MVVNPISGSIDKSELIETVSLFAADCGIDLILYQTTGAHDFTNIKTLYKAYRPERIIVAGGDGTIKSVAEATEDDDVIIGILPVGSSNGLSVELNLMNSPEENLEVAFGNNYIEIDVISINGKKSIHLSDIGLNAELVKNYQKSALHGKWGYALQIFNTLIEEEGPFNAVIEANSQTIKCEARMIVIANCKKYGTGVVINPNGLMNDGKFELVILKNLDLIVFGKIITGNMPIDLADVEIISTDSAIITTDVPVSFQIDGEYCGAESRLEMSIANKKIKIAVPVII